MAEDLNFYLGGAEAIIGRETAVTLARREFCSSVWFIHSCFHLCSEVIKVLSICLIPSFFFFFFEILFECVGPSWLRAFSSCGEQGLLFIAVRELLLAVASLVAEHGL